MFSNELEVKAAVLYAWCIVSPKQRVVASSNCGQFFTVSRTASFTWLAIFVVEFDKEPTRLALQLGDNEDGTVGCNSAEGIDPMYVDEVPVLNELISAE